jgi:predicted phage terminase large subunit-like protein
VLIVDDPIKNRKEAESEVYRQAVHEWFTSTAMSRFEPGCPMRCIVNMARWHDDDLIGRLLKDEQVEWSYMNLPAVTDDGRALWHAYSLESLDLKRRVVGEYDWASLYMGQPMPREGYVFREPQRYKLPDITGARIAIGCDPAATSKTSSDYSAIVVLAAKGTGASQTVDVLDVWRDRVEVPELVKKLDRISKHWGAPVFVEAVGGFKAVPQMLRALNPKLRVVDLNPTVDKFTRSLPAKAAWNDGRLRVPLPRTNSWVDPFVDEICKFTGKNDAHDDQVDALAHAFSAVDQRTPAGKRGVISLKEGYL